MNDPLLHESLKEAHGKLKPYNDMEMNYPNYPVEEWNNSNDPEDDPQYEPGEVDIGETED